jgi:uncharacterized SAM-binding protein YcdF (DUF218 family)
MSPWVFAVYKVVKVAVYPLSWILVLLLLALIASWRGRRRLLHVCLVAAFIVTYGLSLPVVARLLTKPIEQRHSAPTPTDQPATEARYHAVVVLAGGVQRLGGLRREDRLEPEALDRLVCGKALMAAGLAPLLVLSGGNADPGARLTPEADVMARTLRTLGPIPGEVLIEPRSRTTYENAVETRKLLGPDKRIALVTSALHMPRAVALFTQQGLAATAFPCEYLTGPRARGARGLLPDLRYLRQSTLAINEWVGLWLYRVAGKASRP